MPQESAVTYEENNMEAPSNNTVHRLDQDRRRERERRAAAHAALRRAKRENGQYAGTKRRLSFTHG